MGSPWANDDWLLATMAAPTASANPNGAVLIYSSLGVSSFLSALARVSRNLTTEHREDQLPVALRSFLVVDVAVGQRVAMLGAPMDCVGILHPARLKQRAQLVHHRQRRVRIEL